MLSWEVADLFEYLVIVDSRGWYARSSLVLYRDSFRVIVVVDCSIRMMVVMMVMMMRNGGWCITGHAYWRAILSILAVMMVAGCISWFF